MEAKRAFRCANCGTMSSDTKKVYLQDYSNFSARYCPACVRRLTYVCTDCGKLFYGRPYASRSMLQLCRDCRNKYYICDHCNKFVKLSQAVNNSDGIFCKECARILKTKVRIKTYGYKPTPLFKKLRTENDNLFIGMELEVTSRNISRDVVMQALHDDCNDNTLEKHIYFKEDCSLSGGGIEIVTQPCTPGYFKKSKLIDRISEVLHRYRVTSHDSECCGLHFHVSRKFFGSKERDCINKIAAWITRYKDEIRTISRRSSSNLNSWAPVFNYEYSTTYNYRGGRGAINCGNANTIEFRFFRGNTRADRIYQSLHVIERVCRLAKEGTLEELMAVTPVQLYNEVVVTNTKS